MGPFFNRSRRSKKELIDWQLLVVEGASSKRPQFTEAQLQSITNGVASKHIQIVQESIAICETTTNPDTFYSRLTVALDHVKQTLPLEPYAEFGDLKPSELLATVEPQLGEYMLEFINRYLNDVVYKASSLKTQKAKQNRYDKAIESLKPYFDQMPEGIAKYIESYSWPYETSCAKN